MTIQWRDALRRIVPVWLSDRRASGLVVGFSLLWSIAALLDAASEMVLQGFWARLPGRGTPTALPKLGADRRTFRSPSDTDATFAARLVRWLQRWEGAGNAIALARELREYLPSHGMIRIVTRGGHWVTVTAGGVVSWADYPFVWDYDSISNPERSAYWSEFWVIVYGPDFASGGTWGAGTWGDEPKAFGQDVSLSVVDTARAVIDDWKAAHARCRAVIWTLNAADFDPTNGGSLQPDGRWGKPQKDSGGVAVSSRPTSLRFWEFQDV